MSGALLGRRQRLSKQKILSNTKYTLWPFGTLHLVGARRQNLGGSNTQGIWGSSPPSPLLKLPALVGVGSGGAALGDSGQTQTGDLRAVPRHLQASLGKAVCSEDSHALDGAVCARVQRSQPPLWPVCSVFGHLCCSAHLPRVPLVTGRLSGGSWLDRLS